MPPPNLALTQVDVDLFHGTVLAQLLLRPRGALRAGVDAALKDVPEVGGAKAFVAIHLRQLEGGCEGRLRGNLLTLLRITAADLGRAATARAETESLRFGGD